MRCGQIYSQNPSKNPSEQVVRGGHGWAVIEDPENRVGREDVRQDQAWAMEPRISGSIIGVTHVGRESGLLVGETDPLG